MPKRYQGAVKGIAHEVLLTIRKNTFKSVYRHQKMPLVRVSEFDYFESKVLSLSIQLCLNSSKIHPSILLRKTFDEHYTTLENLADR